MTCRRHTVSFSFFRTVAIPSPEIPKLCHLHSFATFRMSTKLEDVPGDRRSQVIAAESLLEICEDLQTLQEPAGTACCCFIENVLHKVHRQFSWLHMKRPQVSTSQVQDVVSNSLHSWTSWPGRSRWTLQVAAARQNLKLLNRLEQT